MFLVATIFCSILANVLGNCPEGRCKSDETCCPTPTPGYYGCCRMPKATCCPDGNRCCPEGMECGIDQCMVKPLDTLEKRLLEEQHQTLVDTTTTTDSDVGDQTATTTESYSSRLNLCNRQSYCPSSYECCVEQSGFYNCCPPNSICCRNSGHCCPQGTQCDLVTGRCRPPHPYHVPLQHPTIPMLSKRRGLIENSEASSTPVQHGPMNPAFSNRHDLVENYKNDDSSRTSVQHSSITSDFSKRNDLVENYENSDSSRTPVQHDPMYLDFNKRQGLIENYDVNEANINRCDKQSYCPDEYSCCVRPNGLFGCCPYPNAVCCGDRLHCCPEGEVCDEDSRMCISGEVRMPTFGMEKAVPFLNEDGDL